MNFCRYGRYKDSGVPWLGEVPEHWEISRVRHLCQIKKRIAGALGFDVLSITQQGIRVKDTSTNEGQLSMDYSKYQLVDVGDFAMNHMDLLTGWVGIADRAGVTSPDYRVFSIIDESKVDRLYLLYLSQMGYSNRIFYAYGQGSSHLGRWRLPTQQFNNLLFPVPPLEEQRTIAAFLSGENARIDSLIAEQRYLVELLSEKRQALISSAVIKGLDSDALIKPSGIECLGAVPAHWTVTTARRVIRRIEQGWSPDCYARPATEVEWGVLRSGCVNRGRFSADDNKALPADLMPIPEYEVRAGDVLMSRASGSPALVGSTALVTAVRPRLMISDKIFRLHLEASIEPEYFVALFNSAGVRWQIERAISGAEGLANNLPQSALRSFAIVVPPRSEQRAIAEFVGRKVRALDALIIEAEKAIALLRERRAALIAAAVTGKIDLREHMKRQAA